MRPASGERKLPDSEPRARATGANVERTSVRSASVESERTEVRSTKEKRRHNRGKPQTGDARSDHHPAPGDGVRGDGAGGDRAASLRNEPHAGVGPASRAGLRPECRSARGTYMVRPKRLPNSPKSVPSTVPSPLKSKRLAKLAVPSGL